MGLVEKRHEFRPDSGEAPFAIDEVFFSRTDKRGIIQASNYIFKRVSGYDWDEMLGAPHKLIRHPDMPKGVFHLLWDTLKNDKPMGAYVKNKAKDGLPYWVYAIAMPIDGGYLSVRIKPSSDVLAKVKELYKGLGQTETDDGYEPDEAACVLQNQISELGYADYNAFETDCLMQELASRDQKMGNTVFPAIADFEKMRLIASDLLAETKTLSSGFKSISAVPTNMRIIAARLEPSGGAVSSLSQNYWSMSEEMSDWFNSNVNNTDSDFAEIHKILNTSRFLFGTARIMKILATEFSRERRDLGRGDHALEQKIVSDLAASYISKAISGLEKIASVARDILTSVGIMRRYTLGLSSTRVMCNIESARLPSGGGSLVDVIQQLGRFQDDVEKQLSQIEDHSLKILEISEGLAASKGGL